jgi:hypothetical protein
MVWSLFCNWTRSFRYESIDVHHLEEQRRTISIFSVASFRDTESFSPFGTGEEVPLEAVRRATGEVTRGLAAARAVAPRVMEEDGECEDDTGRLDAVGLTLGEAVEVIAASAGVNRCQKSF